MKSIDHSFHSEVPMFDPSLDEEIIDRCPGCSSSTLFRVSDGKQTNYLCQSCERCWHRHGEETTRVRPAACPGCEWRSRCESRWDALALPTSA
jgi:hypothetical protein